MSAVDEILSQVDLGQLAQRVGADPAEVEQAARTALPALLGGLDANAADPAGAASLAEALGQHDPGLVEGGVDLDQVDEGEGDKIAQHIFGDNRDQVVNQLGGVGGSAGKGLLAKLIPILAPIVLSWLAKKVLGGAADATQTGAGASPGGGLGDILGQVLGGATKGTQSGGVDTGSIITDVLGGLLGGGRR
ncbi:protein of unknown function [Pedococcus dokdonensis]|uniref:DUF937 domain-containing protein n=1 Tax=Pedococcus dokdonensis TaxID=443156 RepID=A0A1H0LJF8_9MICO|nr:DUF937 domain-containing protein [Pedococcus dokdonensis]SDO68070.1 protein of unknown function [Pedococcus dokdonensis]